MHLHTANTQSNISIHTQTSTHVNPKKTQRQNTHQNSSSKHTTSTSKHSNKRKTPQTNTNIDSRRFPRQIYINRCLSQMKERRENLEACLRFRNQHANEVSVKRKREGKKTGRQIDEDVDTCSIDPSTVPGNFRCKWMCGGWISRINIDGNKDR